MNMASRKKKLLYQSQHRGMKEVDIFLGAYAEKHLRFMSENELILFEALLKERDLDLYNWITGNEPPPEHLNHHVMYAIKKFNAGFQPLAH